VRGSLAKATLFATIFLVGFYFLLSAFSPWPSFSALLGRFFFPGFRYLCNLHEAANTHEQLTSLLCNNSNIGRNNNNNGRRRQTSA